MTEPNTTKIDNLLRSLLSGAQDRDADTPKRRERGAARFDKAYLGIVAYVSKLEKDLAAYKASNAALVGRIQASAVRSNTESSAGRIPRTPGR
mgnify:CR=1 FL=1